MSCICSIILSMSCLLYAFVLCLNFIFSFILHPSCIIPLLISSFLSLLPLDWFVYSWQKGGEFTEKFTGVFRHVYMTHVHILRGRNSTSCTFIGRESCRGRKHFFRKPYFTLCLFSLCFMMLWVMFSIIYALLLLLHHAYVLNTHASLWLFGWSFALLCDHCSHFYMTVLVYDQVAHMFHMMLIWLQFICYIILVLLLLSLPW